MTNSDRPTRTLAATISLLALSLGIDPGEALAVETTEAVAKKVQKGEMESYKRLPDTHIKLDLQDRQAAKAAPAPASGAAATKRRDDMKITPREVMGDRPASAPPGPATETTKSQPKN